MFIMFIMFIMFSWKLFLMVDWHPYFISIIDVIPSHDSLMWCEFGFKDSHQGPGIWGQFSCKGRNPKLIPVYARESKVDSHKGLWIYVDSTIGQRIPSWFPYRDGNPVIFLSLFDCLMSAILNSYFASCCTFEWFTRSFEYDTPAAYVYILFQGQP